MTIDSNGTSFFQKFGWTVMSWIQNLPSVFSYTAPTRHFGRRTRVRRGVLRATPLPARRAVFLFSFYRYRRRTGRFRPKFKKQKVRNAPFGWNLKLKKKKKKVAKTHRLDKNPISQSTVLIFSSLSLSGLCAPRHGSLASALRLPSLTLTQSHSQESQLSTHSHSALHLPSGINLKLSILVFHSSYMLWLLLNASITQCVCDLIFFFFFFFFFFLYKL